MLAAHEMFKNANRVSRAEKALILGFMAGARGKEQQSTVLCVKTPRSIAGYFEREKERVREGGGGGVERQHRNQDFHVNMRSS